MPIATSRTFVARGTLSRKGASLPITVYGTILSVGHEPILCTVIAEDLNWPREFGNLFDVETPFQIEARTETGETVWIPRFRITQLHSAPSASREGSDSQDWRGRRCEGIAELFALGQLDEFDGSTSRVDCAVTLPPTPLARVPGSFWRDIDGTIQWEGDENGERKGIRWSSRLGEAELIDRYTYFEDVVDLDEAVVRVQRCQVIFSIHQQGVMSLRSVVTDLADVLDDPLLLLSFLSRERLEWYRAAARALPIEKLTDTRDLHQVDIRRWVVLPEARKTTKLAWLDLPARLDSLRSGLFQELLTTYMSSPLRATIRQVIPYIIASHTPGYFEAHLGLIYSALEGLVDGTSKTLDEQTTTGTKLTYLLGASRFEKLCDALKVVIRANVSDQALAEGIIKKLPELRRRAFHDRLASLLATYRLDTLRLATSGAPITTALADIIRRRDLYIHQGKVDAEQQYMDFKVIQGLTELWVLRLLGCPDSAVNGTAYHQVLLLDT